MAEKIQISFCEFADGTFDLYVRDLTTGEAAQISGVSKITDRERETLFRLMPPCVYTTYLQASKERATPSPASMPQTGGEA